MKKNMLALLILILTVVNLSLTAVMLFLVVPNAKRTDKLITEILSIVELELESPTEQKTSYDITKIEKVELDSIKCNLKMDPNEENPKNHYAEISFSVTVDTKHEDYKAKGGMVATLKPDIKQIVMNNVGQMTLAELNDVNMRKAAKKQILTEIQTLFDSTMIVDCTLDAIAQ